MTPNPTYRSGVESCQRGESHTASPHEPMTQKHGDWMAGWMAESARKEAKRKGRKRALIIDEDGVAKWVAA